MEKFWDVLFVMGCRLVLMVMGLVGLTVIVTFLQEILFGCGCW